MNLKLLALFTNLLMVGTCGGLMYLNYRIGGTALIKEGFFLPKTGVFAFLKNALIVVIPLSIIAGQLSMYYAKRPENVRAMISGRKGIALAVFLGAVIPGGSSTGPVVQDEWRAGGDKYAILAFLTSMLLLNWVPVVFRIPFFGLRLSLIIGAVSAGIGLIVLMFIGLAHHIRT